MSYYSDDTITLHHGDALDVAKTLESASVQVIVTSPPYFGLRDYGVAEGQMGAEETLDSYVAGMAALFGELRRVLADDGTLWLNLGDSYATRWGSVRSRYKVDTFDTDRSRRPLPQGTVAKNLLGVPWKVAFALQDDGWILRSDIIWSKPNPMPSSATDRPTTAHEYLFLFAKQKRYFYDGDAIAEDAAASTLARLAQNVAAQRGSDRAAGGAKANGPMRAVGGEKANKRTVWTVPTASFAEAHFATYPPELIRPCIRAGSRPGDTVLDPFSGSGTTGMVATEEGRKYVGIDLNKEYLDLSLRTRFAQPPLTLDALT